jgi:hypothetical protein
MSDFSPPPLPPEPPQEPPPPPPPPQLPPARRGIPWDERDRLGFVGALVETLKLVLFDPVTFFRAMPVSGGLGSPLSFGMLVGYFGIAVSGFYDAVFQSVAGQMFGDFARRGDFQRFTEMFGGMLGFVFTLVLGPVFILVGLFLGAGITHLALMLLGGARQGFETTFRVACFSQAPAVFALVPFCGRLVHVVYQIVLAIIGLSEAHQISRWTAAGAVLLPYVLLCCCCAASLGAMFGGIAGLAGLPR